MRVTLSHYPCHSETHLPLSFRSIPFRYEMGTLTSCSFMPLNSEFRSNPVRRAFRERIQCHKLTRLRGSSSFFSRARVPNFHTFRSFATNNNKIDNDKDNNVAAAGDETSADDSKSNLTTTLPEEERPFASDKSTPPSTSHRVQTYLQTAWWFMNSLPWLVISLLCLRSFNFLYLLLKKKTSFFSSVELCNS